MLDFNMMDHHPLTQSHDGAGLRSNTSPRLIFRRHL